MTAQEITEKALKRSPSIDIQPYLVALRQANDGAINDVLNVNGCAYYQWVPYLLEVVKPKQIVELGGAMGVWDLMVLNAPYQDCELHSITLAEHGLEFSYIVDKYPHFHPVVGDDLLLENWGKLDLHKTDLWFFDSLHTEEQLRKELDLYSPFFKKGCVVLFDDIHQHEGMQNVWDDIVEGKWGITDAHDATNPLHWTGYGVCKI